MSTLVPTQTQTGQSRKRKTDLVNETQPKRSRQKLVIMNKDERTEFLSLVDPKKSLAIHEFIHSYEDDVLVQEHFDLLYTYKVKPLLPSNNTINQWLHHSVKVEPEKDFMKTLVNNFLKYFSVKYFTNNVTKANEMNKTLFNPRHNFWIPQYHELPAATHQRLYNLKFHYAKEVQVETVHGTIFVLQNLVLRNIHEIQKYLSIMKVIDETERQTALELFLAMSYTIAKVEFPERQNVKVIDWTEYEDKTIKSEPGWRKEEDGDPPTSSMSKFSEPVFTKIDNNEYKLDGAFLDQVDKTFMSSIITKRSIQNKKPTFQKKKRNANTTQKPGSTSNLMETSATNIQPETSSQTERKNRKFVHGKRRKNQQQSQHTIPSSSNSAQPTGHKAADIIQCFT